jgi:tRNA A-37 threonylcarbamoyl transferase component Bud32
MASITGWGGVMNNISTGGDWQPNEATHHINYLELLAAYFVLKSFLKDVLGKHIKMIVKNTTAVSVINNMGTCHSDPLVSNLEVTWKKPCATDWWNSETSHYRVEIKILQSF